MKDNKQQPEYWRKYPKKPSKKKREKTMQLYADIENAKKLMIWQK